MTLSYLFLLFMIYSVAGWFAEVIYCSVIERKLVNRGFLIGPLCPVYGFGGILVVFLLSPFADNIFYLFTMAVVVTSTLEYVTGWALETIFSTKWWDYSHFRFNVHGRICLLNSVIFGLLSVVAVRIIHPAVVYALAFLPADSIDLIAVVLFGILVIDIAATLRALVDLHGKLSALAEFMENVKESLDLHEWFNELDLAGSLERIREHAKIDTSGTLQKMSDRFEQLIQHSRGVFRLIGAFPALKKALAPQSAATAAASESKSLHGGLYEYFWVFFAASFVGVVIETIWCVVTTGHLQSRAGLLYGMLNPVYGAGAVIMTAVLARMEKKRDMVVFFCGMIIGSVFEYFCSLGQELIFGSVSWEYSGTQLNIQGRTNLMFALIWGLLGLVWVREMLPVLVSFVGKLPDRAGKALACSLAILMLANCSISALAVHRWSERKQGIPPANRVERFVDEHYQDDVMLRTYPNMQFVD